MATVFRSITEEGWYEHARCQGQAKEVDFFDGSDSSIRIAKAICSTCPVLYPCLEWAMANDEEGIWGGTTERERRRLRRQRKNPELQPPPCVCGSALTVVAGQNEDKARCLSCGNRWYPSTGQHCN